MTPSDQMVLAFGDKQPGGSNKDELVFDTPEAYQKWKAQRNGQRFHVDNALP